MELVARPSHPLSLPWYRLLIATLLGLLAFFLVVTPATASFADEVGEEYDFRISGNVKNEGEPIAGVRIVVEGEGYSAETVTDEEGKWRVGVPEQAIYNVFLDQNTLPEGIAVLEGGDTQQVEIGPSGSVVKNFFIGEGEREVTSLFDQIISRLIYGVNFGLMLGLAAIGLSLVYGTTGLSNFSHAELVTFGAIAALVFGVILELPLWIAFPACPVSKRRSRLATRCRNMETFAKKGAGPGPAHDRQYWSLARCSLRLPVLRRRWHHTASRLECRQDSPLRSRRAKRCGLGQHGHQPRGDYRFRTLADFLEDR